MVAWIRMIVMEVVRSGQIHGRGRADSFAVVRCDRKGSIRNDFRFSAEHVHWWTLRWGMLQEEKFWGCLWKSNLVLDMLTSRCSFNFQVEIGILIYKSGVQGRIWGWRIKLGSHQHISSLGLNEIIFEVGMHREEVQILCPEARDENTWLGLTHFWLRQDQFQWMRKVWLERRMQNGKRGHGSSKYGHSIGGNKKMGEGEMAVCSLIKLTVFFLMSSCRP